MLTGMRLIILLRLLKHILPDFQDSNGNPNQDKPIVLQAIHKILLH